MGPPRVVPETLDAGEVGTMMNPCCYCCAWDEDPDDPCSPGWPINPMTYERLTWESLAPVHERCQEMVNAYMEETRENPW